MPSLWICSARVIDPAAKRNAATDQIRAAAERLDDLHARLETLRLARRDGDRF